jgi:hypothetical protein
MKMIRRLFAQEIFPPTVIAAKGNTNHHSADIADTGGGGHENLVIGIATPHNLQGNVSRKFR